MNLGLIISIIFIVIDILISLWNSYNAGQTYRARRTLGAIFYFFGGFLPMGYMVLLTLTLILGYLGYLSFSTFTFLFSFSFLFFGLTFIIWGIIATVTSAMAFSRTHSWTSGFITIYDAVATVFDAWEYVSGFFSAWKSVRRSIDSSDFSVVDVIAIAALALAIGFLITYVAFKEGMKNSRIVRTWY
ncbi:hypothetical protein L3N51_01868 [Metallosphaera sp. J1]|uniref:hypothetical protein n=1 Tax=Metallosphaera javensis (ex Hofmann et al. 2022) TaxID=99938 RepID=UPI001EDD8998|nr:hypothetical protein [Metallosphaera javensis (ex Hofmann et al. 2022)]MCG3109573.1 hypothetical protein [Metallosphaera javensis (ex Hofmann et al. 2022)]